MFDFLCIVAAQNERHAAWEALFLKKTSATLHGSAPGRQLAPPPRPRTSATLHGKHCFSKKRAPRCMRTLLAGPRRHQNTPRPRQDRPLKKYRFFIKNIDFSLEKCRFGAKKGVLHYVFRRKMVILTKNDNFHLEICVKPKKGRTALQPQASLSLIC